MSFFVCSNGVLQCSFGSAPSTLLVLPVNKCLSSMPFANIMDNKPLVNIQPFATCSSPTNPAAAAGVLTPVPCIPAIQAPWFPGACTVLLNNYPALNQESKLMCQWGGVIQVQQPGQNKVTIPS